MSYPINEESRIDEEARIGGGGNVAGGGFLASQAGHQQLQPVVVGLMPGAVASNRDPIKVTTNDGRKPLTQYNSFAAREPVPLSQTHNGNITGDRI